jgi:hypothetical protein
LLRLLRLRLLPRLLAIPTTTGLFAVLCHCSWAAAGEGTPPPSRQSIPAQGGQGPQHGVDAIGSVDGAERGKWDDASQQGAGYSSILLSFLPTSNTVTPVSLLRTVPYRVLRKILRHRYSSILLSFLPTSTTVTPVSFLGTVPYRVLRKIVPAGPNCGGGLVTWNLVTSTRIRPLR